MDQTIGETDLLVQRAVQGDDEAIGALFERHRAYLKVMARRLLDDRLAARVDASDVVQQTMLSAYGHFAEFDGRTAGEFLAWLRIVHERNVRDVARRHLGAEKRNAAHEVDGGASVVERHEDGTPTSVSQRLMADERAVQLARELDRLPEHQQEALRLRYLEGYPIVRIAEVMGRTEQSVVGLVKRGLAALRQRIRETGDGT